MPDSTKPRMTSAIEGFVVGKRLEVEQQEIPLSGTNCTSISAYLVCTNLWCSISRIFSVATVGGFGRVPRYQVTICTQLHVPPRYLRYRTNFVQNRHLLWTSHRDLPL